MSVGINGPVNQSILTEAKKAFDNDGRLDKKEAQQLKQLVNSSNLPADIKAGVNSFLDKAKDASSGFLGIFGRDISSKELNQLKQLTNSLGNNPLAKDLLSSLENSHQKLNSTDNNSSKKYKSSSKEPNSVSFDKSSDKTSCAANVKSWHTAQFSEYDKKYGDGAFFRDKDTMRAATGGDSPKAGLKGREADFRMAYSSCGPTALKMVLDSKGIASPDIGKIRDTMNEGRYGATDADNVVNGLKKLSCGKLNPKKLDITSDAKTFSDNLRNEIKNGRTPIMLSAYISDNAPSGGHYMVVTGVKPDGSITVSDPYSTAPTRDISFEKLKESFDFRKNNHKGNEDNVIISA